MVMDLKAGQEILSKSDLFGDVFTVARVGVQGS